MSKNRIIDLLGNELSVGDKVAWGEKSSTSTAYLKAGEIIQIVDKGIYYTDVLIKITNDGRKFSSYNYKTIRYPRNYKNLVKIG